MDNKSVSAGLLPSTFLFLLSSVASVTSVAGVVWPDRRPYECEICPTASAVMGVRAERRDQSGMGSADRPRWAAPRASHRPHWLRPARTHIRNDVTLLRSGPLPCDIVAVAGDGMACLLRRQLLMG